MLGDSVREATMDLLSYNSVTTRLSYKGKDYFIVEAVFDNREICNSDKADFNFTTEGKLTNLYVESLGRTYTSDDLNNTPSEMEEVIKHLQTRTEYHTKGKRPLDVYSLFNMLSGIIVNSTDTIHLTLTDLELYNEEYNMYTPLLHFYGSRGLVSTTDGIARKEFSIEVASKGSKAYLRASNNSVDSKYNSSEFIEVSTSMVVGFVISQYTHGDRTPHYEKCKLSFVQDTDIASGLSILGDTKQGKVQFSNKSTTKKISIQSEASTLIDGNEIVSSIRVTGRGINISVTHGDKRLTCKSTPKTIQDNVMGLLASVGITSEMLEEEKVSFNGVNIYTVLNCCKSLSTVTPYTVLYMTKPKDDIKFLSGVTHDLDYGSAVTISTSYNEISILSRNRVKARAGGYTGIINTKKPTELGGGSAFKFKANDLSYFIPSSMSSSY